MMLHIEFLICLMLPEENIPVAAPETSGAMERDNEAPSTIEGT